MRPIVGLLTTQPRAAKLILVIMLARLESALFFRLTPRREGRAVDVRRAGPHAAPAGASGANVVIHLPTRPQAVGFVRRAHIFDHLAPDGVTKIREAIERLQHARLAPE